MLYLVVAGKLACPWNPQSCASRSLVLLAGSTMPDLSAREETTPWSSKLGVGHVASFLTTGNKSSYSKYQRENYKRFLLWERKDLQLEERQSQVIKAWGIWKSQDRTSFQRYIKGKRRRSRRRNTWCRDLLADTKRMGNSWNQLEAKAQDWGQRGSLVDSLYPWRSDRLKYN